MRVTSASLLSGLKGVMVNTVPLAHTDSGFTISQTSELRTEDIAANKIWSTSGFLGASDEIEITIFTGQTDACGDDLVLDTLQACLIKNTSDSL